MRRTGLLLASVALALLLACGVALAAQISCPNGAGNLCVGTAQGDTMTGRVDATDVMRGAGGADTLDGLGGDDRLAGEAGLDTVSGAGGDDTYVAPNVPGSDRDRIPEGGEDGGTDTIDLSGVDRNARAWLGPPYNKVGEDIGGVFQGNAFVSFTSTTVIENYRGGTGTDEVYGNGARNRLYGNDETDELYGRDGADYLSGGLDNDRLYGDAGNDVLEGGGGSDRYVFQLDFWGNDTIRETASDSDSVQFGGNRNELTQNLTIDLASSPDAPEVVNESGAGRVNWSGNVIENVDIEYSSADDTIAGNADVNRIFSSRGGSDTVSTLAGDDLIYVDDDEGDDHVDCGEDGPGITDNDTVHYDAGDTITNCETQIPGS